ncbi:MAG: hypothetical protein LKI30_07790 [Bifidobacterium crudilactis]|jgi:hypothetical protein|nr:hypothetical protein [Bifidobacterium crudilactis]
MTSEITVRDKRWAERITERLRLQSTIFTDSRNKIIDLLHEAQDGDAAGLLGYKSWTAYISDVFGEQPLRLEKDLRREFVKELSSEGMSTRAIAPIVGVSKSQVATDIEVSSSGQLIDDVLEDGQFRPPESESSDYSVASPEFEDVPEPDVPVDARTGEILDSPETKTVTGLDGKQYKVPERQSAKPRRTPITERFTSRTVDLIKLVDSFTRLVGDDRFDTNKQNIADMNASDIKRAVVALSKVLDALETTNKE